MTDDEAEEFAETILGNPDFFYERWTKKEIVLIASFLPKDFECEVTLRNEIYSYNDLTDEDLLIFANKIHENGAFGTSIENLPLDRYEEIFWWQLADWIKAKVEAH